MDFAYYILTPFSWLLQLFYDLTGSYGFALILFAVVVKLILFPFSLKGKKSMIQMNMLQGKMQQIQRKYANDKQRQNLEIQKLYEKEKVNPMGGCLWSLLPIFILLPLYAIIRQPMKYMMGLDETQITTLIDVLNQYATTAIDPSKNTVTAKLADETVVLDYTKGLDANASDLYQKGKEIGDKAKRAKEALDESRAELAKLEKGINKAKALAAGRAEPTKQFWFERYKWFVTPQGRLVIAGKDAHTNDNIVKKHLKEKDVYAHADVHGAPSVILKDGIAASEQELRDACHFAIAQSKAWVAALAEGGAFWVYPDQVSKTPNPGEFVPRGAFIIRGKRNYEYHLPMELVIGETYYQGSRKVMCGPHSCFENCDRYIVIRPGKGKAGRKTNEVAKRFQVPEEEISRILPPGDFDIVREVWPAEDAQEE